MANLGTIVNKARSNGSRVILTTIFGLGLNACERLDPATVQIQAAIERVNRTIRHIAAPNVVIFDSVAILADESGFVAEQYRDDLLHINAAGYRVLNEALGNLLAAQLQH
ncbi:SGNH/GDSL hydrolase family protein [uncultured Chloroflexus sp.]|uniref:SGNH/GDSL hydrolase family protein n=1 Tax=uncultured Chloroflexus sp. TaxID=214040 RepID=UPI00262EC3B6|nr:SGNH/GDSL hydrolase family protein [uncultured Chloroflexus sp.]